MNDDDKNAFVQWGVAAASIVRRGKIIITINYTNKPLLQIQNHLFVYLYVSVTRG